MIANNLIKQKFLFSSKLFFRFTFIFSFLFTISIHTQNTPQTKEEIIAANAKVQVLNWGGKKDASEHIYSLHNYVNLQSLDLGGAYIQNADLKEIQNPKLSYLNLSNTIVTSEGVS
ncbi:MAG TPA: hypothetical protein PKD50_08095, partial [Leptospiraceae bacterium]|nr:hypothetical protein [Leptospiraceae bacterium]